MLKLITITVIVLVLTLNESNQQSISQQSIQRWLYSCSEGECSEAIDNCNEKKCLGKSQCIKCVGDYDYDCKRCAEEIFSKFTLVDGKFICHDNDSLQQKVCQLYCQGSFYNSGECRRDEKSIPQCYCENKKTSTEATTTQGVTQTTFMPTTEATTTQEVTQTTFMPTTEATTTQEVTQTTLKSTTTNIIKTTSTKRLTTTKISTLKDNNECKQLMMIIDYLNLNLFN
jgi:hypothetical protein